ncbi:polyadenylate-binding 1 [Olea europaea subsp. europaea]|uniref:Polyadenylate-binding 1 n=1 Tax=Olea europaea subsp. europaea TaxID=158383 RepID=A0A8S0TVM6_OLEEU|nr:polyadenylate-binding 1 [Olea europaea subsp. europaea]
MEHKGHNEQEDDVYGSEVPDEAYMDADFDAEAEADADESMKAKELESVKKRLQEIEEEVGVLREMQAKVEKEMDAAQEDLTDTSATQTEKEEVDSRSIYVVGLWLHTWGGATAFSVNWYGFAYVEFVETEAVQNALLLNESELRGRQLKVSAKRNNVPGMKQYRGRRPNPYYGSRRSFMPGPPMYPPYGYGQVLGLVFLAFTHNNEMMRKWILLHVEAWD